MHGPTRVVWANLTPAPPQRLPRDGLDHPLLPLAGALQLRGGLHPARQRDDGVPQRRQLARGAGGVLRLRRRLPRLPRPGAARGAARRRQQLRGGRLLLRGVLRPLLRDRLHRHPASAEDAHVGPEAGPTSAFSGCIPTGMHGPACTCWASLTAFSPQERTCGAGAGWAGVLPTCFASCAAFVTPAPGCTAAHH
jgi:hypothetical protein